MLQPRTHEHPPHALWGHKWNPYHKRDTCTHQLDKATFDRLVGRTLSDYTDPELFMTGCLDAPDDIPLGATACIRTIGGYDREEYLTLGREWESWARYMHATAETAEWLKEILKETE